MLVPANLGSGLVERDLHLWALAPGLHEPPGSDPGTGKGIHVRRGTPPGLPRNGRQGFSTYGPNTHGITCHQSLMAWHNGTGSQMAKCQGLGRTFYCEPPPLPPPPRAGTTCSPNLTSWGRCARRRLKPHERSSPWILMGCFLYWTAAETNREWVCSPLQRAPRGLAVARATLHEALCWRYGLNVPLWRSSRLHWNRGTSPADVAALLAPLWKLGPLPVRRRNAPVPPLVPLPGAERC